MGNAIPTLPQIPSQNPKEPPNEELDQQLQPTEQENRVFTCEICIEPTPISEKRFNNGSNCSHPFCTDCVIKYIRVKLEDHNIGIIKCPAFDCDRTLDPFSCSSLIGPQLFVRWCDVLCQAAIGGLDQCYCPYTNCNILIVNECGGKVKRSSCPSCKRSLCFECKKVWHAGFRCEESGDLQDRSDRAFGRLAEQKKWRRCPRCRHFVELVAGCQIVRCRCGIRFCYKCGNPVHHPWCHCNTAWTCCDLCFRICVVLVFLTFALFFLFLGN